MRKVLIIVFLSATMLGGAFFYIKTKGSPSTTFSSKTAENILSPFADKLTESFGTTAQQSQTTKATGSIFSNMQRFNVLLIGTDIGAERRSEGQTGFNTDVMILVSVDTKTNKVLLTSVPRDLWINGNKINSLYAISGYDVLKDAYEKITGQKVDAYILTDFDAFRWIVNAFGGVPVDIQTSFTDASFPKMDDSGIQTISFTQGTEVMDGVRALTFARSRKGDNGEGSDLMRAKRQHLLLEGMVNAISQPKSTFWPMDIEGFYTQVLQHMQTDLKLADVYYLWDFYKDRNTYTVESFVVGDPYIYYPGMYPDSPYHAWVFIPRDETWTQLHTDIDAKLNGTFVETTETNSGSDSSTNTTDGTSVEDPTTNFTVN